MCQNTFCRIQLNIHYHLNHFRLKNEYSFVTYDLCVCVQCACTVRGTIYHIGFSFALPNRQPHYIHIIDASETELLKPDANENGFHT